MRYILITLLVGCGTYVPDRVTPSGCFHGAVECQSRNSTPEPGPPGPPGRDGKDGAVGESGATGVAGKDGADGQQGSQGNTGPQGPSGAIGHTGPTGEPGSTGAAGPAGAPGAAGSIGPGGIPGDVGYSLVFRTTTISVGDTICPAGGTRIQIASDTNRSGAWEITDGAQAVWSTCNGVTGADAPPTSYTPVGIVNPCGDAPGVYDEVFLRMANGTLLASFSDNAHGDNTRFSILVPGTYQTTDGDNCVFTVDSSMQIVGESHVYH